ncbi:hypothetical protein ACN4EE_14910 [Geminocystis sp. CENA526]|uniref:WD40 repeat domain-containing protein n=1 Tax=Geminocystis sp. CENA526 TaxID=1355871 RepID=UPI003D6DE187
MDIIIILMEIGLSGFLAIVGFAFAIFVLLYLIYLFGWKRIRNIFIYLWIFTILTAILLFLLEELKIALIISITINTFIIFLRSVFFKINQTKIIRRVIQEGDLNDFKRLMNQFNCLINFSRNTTYTYLNKVNNIEKINIVCDRCFHTRDDLLIKLIIEKNWIATEPAQVKIYTILKTNQLNLIDTINSYALNYLLEFLQDQDSEIADNSFKVLVSNNLMNQENINYLCKQWIKDKDKRLEKIIIKQKYIASYSLKAKILTAFKTQQLSLIKNEGEEGVKILLELLTDKDPIIANNSLKVLNNLTNQVGINYLCKQWVKNREQKLEKIIINQNYFATYPLDVKILTALKTGQIKLLSNLNLEETIILINTFSDTDTIIANNAKKMGDVLQDPSCKSLIYFIAEQWKRYELIDFDQNLLQNVFFHADSSLRKKITEKIKISGRSDWLQVIFAERKRNNIELMTDYDWQVTVELLSKTNNDLEKWKLAQQAPPFYSQQLLKQIHSLDFIKGEKSIEQHLFHLGKKVIPNLSDKICWLNDNSETVTISGHTEEITSLVMNREGTLLGSASDDKTIKLWELPSGRLLHNIIDHTDSINHLVMNREGTLLASASKDKTMKLWELPSGRLLNTLRDHTGNISSLVMNGKGTLLASASKDKTIKLWELPSGRLLNTLRDHTGNISSLVMNGGTLLVLGTRKKTIRLLELPSGRLLNSLTGHTNWITNVVINKEGTLLASGSRDNTIKLWRLSSPSGLDDLDILDDLQLFKIIDHYDWIQYTLKRKDLLENQRNWLEFMLALVDNYRGFDIDIEDAPIITEAGEFDIEIED